MTGFRFFSVTFVLIFLMAAGCSSMKTKMPEVDIKAFQQRCTYAFDMPVNSVKAGVTVLSVPHAIMANIELAPSVENVLYVRLRQDSRLNIEKHLIRNMEYLYDRDEHVLKVIFDLPVIYILSGRISFEISAGVARMSESGPMAEKIEKEVSFFWAPHVTVTEPESGFDVMKYVDAVKADYDGKEELIRTARQEMIMTRVKRLAPDQRSLIEEFTQ